MKTLLNLYIDVDVKHKAKELGINLSQAFQEFLGVLTTEPGQKDTAAEILGLKAELAMKRSKIQQLTKENERLAKKVEKVVIKV